MADPAVVGDGLLNDDEARAVRQELERVAGNVDLVGLTTDKIVEAARDPESPLHRHFTWNVKEAAEKQWRQEARRLIQSVRYVIITQTQAPVRVRSIVSTQTVGTSGRSWMDRGAMMRNPEARAAFVARARDELRQWTRRNVDVEELRVEREAVLSLLK